MRCIFHIRLFVTFQLNPQHLGPSLQGVVAPPTIRIDDGTTSAGFGASGGAQFSPSGQHRYDYNRSPHPAAQLSQRQFNYAQNVYHPSAAGQQGFSFQQQHPYNNTAVGSTEMGQSLNLASPRTSQNVSVLSQQQQSQFPTAPTKTTFYASGGGGWSSPTPTVTEVGNRRPVMPVEPSRSLATPTELFPAANKSGAHAEHIAQAHGGLAAEFTQPPRPIRSSSNVIA